MFPPALVSPWRCTCIAYTDIDTVYLVLPSTRLHALFFVVTAEIIPSGRNPLPGSPNTKLPIRLGVSGLPRLPSLRKYLHSNTGFLSSPKYLVAHLAFSPCDLIESLQFGLSSRYHGLLSLSCLLSLPCLFSLSLANSRQRDPWYRSRGICRNYIYIYCLFSCTLAFFDQSEIWRISESVDKYDVLSF